MWAVPLLLAVLCAPGVALSQPKPPAPAAVQERPVMLPSRDAVLGFHLVPGAGEAIDARVTFRAGGKGLRLDLPDQTYMVVLPETRSVVLVVPAQRTAAELPWADGPQSVFFLDDRMTFTRKGDATVAGQRCVQWEGVFEKNRNLVCVTADGLMLRNQYQDPGGRRNLVEAFVVQFEATRDADFVVPPGFDRLKPTSEQPPARSP